MSDKIKIAVCEDLEDDKTRLVNLIEDYLDKNEMSAEIDTFSSGETFLAADTSVYSLVFFDIYMDKLDGMETAKRLIGENRNVQIVFCTTSRDFAAESYDVSALYYIIKPITEEKLINALDRFFDGIKHLKTITVKVGRIEETIYLRDILYIESDRKKTILHTVNGNIEASMPFSYFCDVLKEPDFVKPIRYALISVSEIAKVTSESVILFNGLTFPVSRGLKQHVKEVFSDYQWSCAFPGKGGRK